MPGEEKGNEGALCITVAVIDLYKTAFLMEINSFTCVEHAMTTAIVNRLLQAVSASLFLSLSPLYTDLPENNSEIKSF